jgi:membrane fusion protein (multidrug efflux system)
MWNNEGRLRLKKIALFGGIGLVIVLAIVGLSPQKANATENESEEKKPEETIYAVELGQVSARTLRTYVTGTATLAADRQVDIYPKLAGQVSELSVEEGARVEAGHVLLVLDGDDARLEMAQAAVNLREAKAEFSRTLKSFQKALISEEDYDKKRYELERIEANYQVAEHKVTQSQVVAPFGGTVVSRDVELGQSIQPSDKLFTLAALNPLKAELYLPESQVGDLRKGMSVTFSRDANFEAGFPGNVARISPVVDKDTGTVKVTVTAADAPVGVRPGTYVHTNIVTRAHEAPAVVSGKALVFDSRQNSYVFVASPVADRPQVYTVKKVPVTTGVQDKGFTQISDGLSAGDLVVLTGKESLKDGTLVKDTTAKVGMVMN